MTDDFDPVTYRDVNDEWRTPLAPITGKASGKLFTKLVVKFGGRKMSLPRFARRFNRSWADPKGRHAGGPGPGLPRMVHDASHWVHEKLHPHAKTHCSPHAELERAMIQHVIAKGWHLPKAKPAKAKPSVDDKLALVDAATKRWTTKAKRAATALRKLQAKRRRLEREVSNQTLISIPHATP
jgi:hypothetical protein